MAVDFRTQRHKRGQHRYLVVQYPEGFDSKNARVRSGCELGHLEGLFLESSQDSSWVEQFDSFSDNTYGRNSHWEYEKINFLLDSIKDIDLKCLLSDEKS